MKPTEVIKELRQAGNKLSINGKCFTALQNTALRYVQYNPRYGNRVHYEVWANTDNVVVRLDDERTNVADGDELRNELREIATQNQFNLNGGQDLKISHSNCVNCTNRSFDEIKGEVQKRLNELYNAFEPILEKAEHMPQNAITANNQQNVNDQQGVKAMEEVTELLKSNLQVVLTGAPGTGKTYMAKQVARAMVGAEIPGATEEQKKKAEEIAEESIASVQFHPGYDYSDFVIGMKPRLVGAEGNQQVTFEWKPGIFKTFADKAKDDLDHNYVFLIDEINRADLSRVFGELFSLLEEDYRYPKNKNGIRLPNGEDFVIPKNLYIIGTMNDIDRSVESMDFALRRRFAWYEVSAESSEGILDAKAKEGKIAEGDVAILKTAMKWLNDIIAPPSTGKDETADSGQGSDKKPDLRLGSAYQLGGAIFAKLEKYVKVVNGNPSVAGADAFSSLWNNHIKNILSEYLRGRRDRDDLLKELETEFTKAVLGKASEPESNSISSDGESQAQANSEQTPQA